MHARLAEAALTLLLAAGPLGFTVDPEAGNNTFSAVFDAALGERITANSSSVACDVRYDEKAGAVSGACSVPLTLIRVDNDDTKTSHFQDWATNKTSRPEECRLEARFDQVPVGRLTAEPVRFTAQVPFTVCGRPRSDGGRETVVGRIALTSAEGEAPPTIRARATVRGFRRSLYRVGPEFTEGWLSRVQRLARVVSDDGTIELALFAQQTTK